MTMLTELGRDAVFALRLLRRAPGFAAIAIATLALGIGASTAIFSIIDGVLLRPLRFGDPDRLIMIRPTTSARLSEGYLHDWRAKARTLADMAGWFDQRVNLTGDGEPLELKADRVTVNFFALLGTPPVIGRTFTATADLGRVEQEAVMSYGLWQRRYGGDPGVIGRRITIDGEPITVIGVMPAGFAIRTTELAESRSDLWLPLRLAPVSRRGMGGSLHVIARLAPQATRDQAQAELAVIARQIEDANPSYSRDWGVRTLPLLDATVMEVRPILLVLFGGVGILLLIACSNVTNLLLARAAGRQAEFAIRLSIGASATRLLRQSLAESLVLSAIGGAFGVLLAMWGTRALVAALPSGLDLPRTQEIGVDARILGFAVLVTIATALVIGIVPAIASTRTAALAALKDLARGSSTTRGRTRIASGLVVSEVALAIVLLAGAGLLARSFYELTRVQPGFNADGVVTLRTTLAASKYDTEDRIRTFNDELVMRTQALPGVRAAGTVSYLPLSSTARADRFEIVGRPEPRLDDQKFALTAVVSGRYFEAMQIPLIRGRLPNETDTAGSEPVFVIDEHLARQHWPDRDPIGERLSWSMAPDRKTPLTGQIIGVVGNVRWTGLTGKPWSSAYMWFPNLPGREISLVVRTDARSGRRRCADGGRGRPDRPESAGFRHSRDGRPRVGGTGPAAVHDAAPGRLRGGSPAAGRTRPVRRAGVCSGPAHAGDRHSCLAWRAGRRRPSTCDPPRRAPRRRRPRRRSGIGAGARRFRLHAAIRRDAPGRADAGHGHHVSGDRRLRRDLPAGAPRPARRSRDCAPVGVKSQEAGPLRRARSSAGHEIF